MGMLLAPTRDEAPDRAGHRQSWGHLATYGQLVKAFLNTPAARMIMVQLIARALTSVWAGRVYTPILAHWPTRASDLHINQITKLGVQRGDAQRLSMPSQRCHKGH